MACRNCSSAEQQMEKQFRIAKGNWRDFYLELRNVLEIARGWGKLIEPIERPWLCWNVEPRWCLLQQKLVSRAGWTPVVGYDPRFDIPPVIDDAVLVNFNERLRLPTLRPMFVVEFAYLFARRLAFWHSDLLLDERRMRHYAEMFAGLEDGEVAAVYSRGGGLRRFVPGLHRYWELLGCTTRAASQHQFDVGCGWWHHFYDHPNFSRRLLIKHGRWDYGYGIAYWARNFAGSAKRIRPREIRDGHFTRIGRRASYVAAEENNWFRNLSMDLRVNFCLSDCARQLGIEQLLETE